MTEETKAQLLNNRVQQTIGNLQVQLISKDILIQELNERIIELEPVKKDTKSSK